jgi:hypothetical protein
MKGMGETIPCAQPLTRSVSHLPGPYHLPTPSPISVKIRKPVQLHWKTMAGFRRRGEFSSRSRFLSLAATSHAPLPKTAARSAHKLMRKRGQALCV